MAAAAGVLSLGAVTLVAEVVDTIMAGITAAITRRRHIAETGKTNFLVDGRDNRGGRTIDRNNIGRNIDHNNTGRVTTAGLAMTTRRCVGRIIGRCNAGQDARIRKIFLTSAKRGESREE